MGVPMFKITIAAMLMIASLFAAPALVGTATLTQPIQLLLQLPQAQAQEAAQLPVDHRDIGPVKFTQRWQGTELVNHGKSAVFFADCLLGEFPTSEMHSFENS